MITAQSMIHRLIPDVRLVCFDTNALIYLQNAVEPYFPFMDAFFVSIKAGERRGVVSVVTETELLVGPIRAGDPISLNKVSTTLSHRNVRIVVVDREVAREAARIRAAHDLKLPDAIIVATAVVSGCDALVGNDRTCARRVTEIPYVYLEEAVGRIP